MHKKSAADGVALFLSYLIGRLEADARSYVGHSAVQTCAFANATGLEVLAPVSEVDSFVATHAELGGTGCLGVEELEVDTGLESEVVATFNGNVAPTIDVIDRTVGYPGEGVEYGAFKAFGHTGFDELLIGHFVEVFEQAGVVSYVEVEQFGLLLEREA